MARNNSDREEDVKSSSASSTTNTAKVISVKATHPPDERRRSQRIAIQASVKTTTEKDLETNIEAKVNDDSHLEKRVTRSAASSAELAAKALQRQADSEVTTKQADVKIKK